MAWITGLFNLVGVLKELFSIGVQLFKFIRDEYEVSQRKAVVQELKGALKEATQSYDNTRLNNLLNPDTEPFPRKSSLDEKPKA